MDNTTSYETLTELLSGNLEESRVLSNELAGTESRLSFIQAEIARINRGFSNNVPGRIKRAGKSELWGNLPEYWESKLLEHEEQVPPLLQKVFELSSGVQRLRRKETQIRSYMGLIRYENRFGRKRYTESVTVQNK